MSEKIINYGIFLSVAFLASFAHTFLEDSPSLSALSAPVTSQPETVPNQPILTQNYPSPLLSQVIEPLVTEGRGSLQVNNGTTSDAYIKLVDSYTDELVASFYVQSNSTFTLEGVPDGLYEVLFASGEDWDSNTRKFTLNQSFAKFDSPFDFTTITRQLTNQIEYQYRIHKVTLHRVVDGNARTSGVNEQEFAQY